MNFENLTKNRYFRPSLAVATVAVGLGAYGLFEASKKSDNEMLPWSNRTVPLDELRDFSKLSAGEMILHLRKDGVRVVIPRSQSIYHGSDFENIASYRLKEDKIAEDYYTKRGMQEGRAAAQFCRPYQGNFSESGKFYPRPNYGQPLMVLTENLPSWAILHEITHYFLSKQRSPKLLQDNVKVDERVLTQYQLTQLLKKFPSSIPADTDPKEVLELMSVALDSLDQDAEELEVTRFLQTHHKEFNLSPEALDENRAYHIDVLKKTAVKHQNIQTKIMELKKTNLPLTKILPLEEKCNTMASRLADDLNWLEKEMGDYQK